MTWQSKQILLVAVFDSRKKIYIYLGEIFFVSVGG